MAAPLLLNAKALDGLTWNLQEATNNVPFAAGRIRCSCGRFLREASLKS